MEQLKLNMIPNGVNPVFHASQYDKGRQIRFVLDETLSGAEVTVSYRAKDGTEHGNVQTSVSGNTITDTIPEEVLTDYGIIEGEVNIDGIGSLNFFVEVEKDAYDGGVITTQTATGAIATFETNIETAFVSLKSDINPVQDLHGYSKPWSGGGGKNKLDYLSNLRASDSGLTISATSGGAIHYQGTAINNYCMLTYKFNLSIPSGTTITVSRDVSLGYQHYFDFTFTDNSIEYVRIMPNTTSTTYTLPKDLKSIDIVCLGLAVGTAYNETVKFQLEIGSQATSWEPYSNICPISGFSALNVTRTGVNLWESTDNNVLGLVGDNIAYLSGAGTIIITHLISGVTYTISGITGKNRGIIGYFESTPAFNDTAFAYQAFGNPDLTFTATNTGLAYIYIANSILDTTHGQLEIGNQASEYHAYNGQTATVNFGQTVYGGVADVTGGKVTATYSQSIKLSDIVGWSYDSTYQYFYTTIADKKSGNINLLCECYSVVDKASATQLLNGEMKGHSSSRNVYIKDTNYTDVTNWLNAVGNNRLIYELATPIEITTTTENLTAIVGQNNVYGDTNGDTTVEYYIEV